VSLNPYLARLLGESAAAPVSDEAAGAPPAAPQPKAPTPAAPAEKGAVSKREPLSKNAPQVQELLRLWQQGEHMGVAAKLMFTEANYVDFVDLIFLLGHDAARELGTLLDELANSENMQPPKTPPEYDSMLQRVAGADKAPEVV